MQINIEIEKDVSTLSRWNFKEEALVLYDNNRHIAIPLSRVNGDALKKIIEEWNKKERTRMVPDCLECGDGMFPTINEADVPVYECNGCGQQIPLEPLEQPKGRVEGPHQRGEEGEGGEKGGL